MDPSRISQVKHLYEVEHLTMRQIARELRMCTKTISRIITGKTRPKKAHKPTILAPSRAKRSAAARPIPWAVPVISATLPSSRPAMAYRRFMYSSAFLPAIRPEFMAKAEERPWEVLMG